MKKLLMPDGAIWPPPPKRVSTEPPAKTPAHFREMLLGLEKRDRKTRLLIIALVIWGLFGAFFSFNSLIPGLSHRPDHFYRAVNAGCAILDGVSASLLLYSRRKLKIEIKRGWRFLADLKPEEFLGGKQD